MLYGGQYLSANEACIGPSGEYHATVFFTDPKLPPYQEPLGEELALDAEALARDLASRRDEGEVALVSLMRDCYKRQRGHMAVNVPSRTRRHQLELVVNTLFVANAAERIAILPQSEEGRTDYLGYGIATTKHTKRMLSPVLYPPCAVPQEHPVREVIQSQFSAGLPFVYMAIRQGVTTRIEQT